MTARATPNPRALAVIRDPPRHAPIATAAAAYDVKDVKLGAKESELQRALISDIGLPVDMVELRPGLATTGVIGGATGAPTQFAVGKALTSRLFVTANAVEAFGEFVRKEIVRWAKIVNDANVKPQ